jgi:hypothetical protein
MRRVVTVDWDTSDESGTDEEATHYLRIAVDSIMAWLCDEGFENVAITMEPDTRTEALRWYVDHPSFNLDGGRRARLALGEGTHTDLEWQKQADGS